MQLVTIIIPCLNERQTIGKCIDSLIDSDFNAAEWEIIVVDGGSDDGTREVLNEYCARYSFIRVIENPQKIKPIALNMGIRAARGESIVRVDAHTEYPRNYVRRLVDALWDHDVDNIGGIQLPIVPEGDGIAQAIGLATSHPFAIGNAHHRSESSREIRRVNTVYCGCFKREVFDRIGLFNEQLVRTQDRELNARIVAAGGRILLDPSIVCRYKPRMELVRHLSWTANGAFWLFYARAFTHIRMVQWRNRMPVAFAIYIVTLVALSISIVAGFSWTVLVPTLLLWLIFLPLLVYVIIALGLAIKLHNERRNWRIVFAFPMVIFLTHVTYGLAATIGWAKAAFVRATPGV